MPLAKISVPSHLSAQQIRQLADAVHAGLVQTCGVPEDDRFQLVTRFAPDAMIINPTFPDMQRSANASVVEISFLQGRTDDQKRALYACIVRHAQGAGFVPDDILVALTENAPIDWSMGRGEAFAGHASPARSAASAAR